MTSMFFQHFFKILICCYNIGIRKRSKKNEDVPEVWLVLMTFICFLSFNTYTKDIKVGIR